MEEAEIPQQPPPPDSKDENEDVRTVVRTRQERRQRQRLVEAAQAPVREQLEAEQGDSEGAGQAGQRPLVPRKEVELPPHRTLSRERWGSGAREEESAGKEPSGGRKWGSEKPAAPGKTCPERSPDSEEVSVSERSPGPEKVSVLEKIAVLEKRTVSGKRSVSEKASISEKLPAPGKTRGSEKRLVSEKAEVFEKPLASGPEPAPTRAAASGQAQEQPASGKSPSITQGQRRARPEEQPASPASEPRAVAGRLPPITLQVGGAPAPTPCSWVVSGSLSLSSVLLPLGRPWPVLPSLPAPLLSDGGPGCDGEHLVPTAHPHPSCRPWEASDPSRSSPGKPCLGAWDWSPNPTAEADGQEAVDGGLDRPACSPWQIRLGGPYSSSGSGRPRPPA